MKFLLVDDSKMARKMTNKVLKAIINDEFEIIEATNGEEAVAKYKEYCPDICFMDLTMPQLDGFEATKQICEFDRDAKIVVISADIQEKSLQKAKQMGALGFIKKPIDEKNLGQVLQQLGYL